MTILSVAIGIFTQQALQTYSCPIIVSGSQAQMPIAQTSFNGIYAVSEGSGADYSMSLALELRAALLAGLSGTQTSGILTAACSTGNCSFDTTQGITYSSATFGTECIDASSLLSQSGLRDWNSSFATNGTNDNTTYGFDWSPDSGVSYQLNFGSVGGRWRNLLSLSRWTVDFEKLEMTLQQRQKVDSSFDSIVLVMPTISPCSHPSEYQASFGDSENTPMPPVNVSLCPQLHMPNISTFPGYFAISATVCFFYPRVRHFDGSIVNGRAQEEVVDDTIMQHSKASGTTIGSAIEPIWLAVLDPCVIDGIIYTSSNYSTGADLTNVSGTLVPTRCVYGFADPWYRAVEVQNGFSQAVTGISGVEDLPDECSPFNNYTQMSCYRAWWLNGVYNGGNASTASVGAFMNRGFDAFTNQLRMMGSDWYGAPSNITGQTFHNVVCTQFTWEWLIFPLGIVIGTVVFLLSALFFGPGEQETVWKASILPLLFYGLEERHRLGHERLWSADHLTAAAKKLDVKFSLEGESSDSWRLRGSGIQSSATNHATSTS